MENAKLGGKFRNKELIARGSLSFAVIHIAAKTTSGKQISLASRIRIFLFEQHPDNTAMNTYLRAAQQSQSICCLLISLVEALDASSNLSCTIRSLGTFCPTVTLSPPPLPRFTQCPPPTTEILCSPLMMRIGKRSKCNT